MVAVPDRLEDAVREPQGEDVLHRLLTQEVVNPEDLALVERGVDGFVQRSCGGEIGPERLLEDDTGVAGEARVAEHRDDAGERDRRDGEVEKPARTRPEFGL